jgi:hypothetical protein
MKLLILTVIVLVVPTFFLLVFVISTVGRLTTLRHRCRTIRECLEAAPAADLGAQPGSEPPSPGDLMQAVDAYNAARRTFPANVLAAVCGFREMELKREQPSRGERP